MPIHSIKARQIYDSRGNPTVEVETHWILLKEKNKNKKLEELEEIYF